MEANFKEPSLKLHRLLTGIKFELAETAKEKLRQYLVTKSNLFIYKYCIENEILSYNSGDLEQINETIKSALEKLENEKKRDLENEASLFEIDKRICEFYAQIMDEENFEKLSKDLIERDPSSSLKMDVYMCKIRMAIIKENRNGLVTNIELANHIAETSSDWDRKNRFKVYSGLFYLIKAEFRQAADQFHGCLASFEASELLEFDTVIFYLVFCSLLAYSRTELNAKILKNSEVNKCKQYLPLVDCLYQCKYDEYFRRIINFIDLMDKDYFLLPFREHFCKEMKIKGYNQLLISYQSFHLQRMAEIYKVDRDYIEEDLRNFINEGRLNCLIDKIDDVIRANNTDGSRGYRDELNKGEEILRNIKKYLK